MSNTPNPKLSRRAMIKSGGLALVGVWGQNRMPVASAGPSPVQLEAGKNSKPLFLPPADSVDPAVHSKAENLFWSDIMMEHANFFALLMPGAELARQRSEAENFQRMFQNQSDRAHAASLNRNNYAALNRSTIELMKPFIEYKHQILDAQNSGKIRTLVFSLFFDHTIREAQRASERLERLASGDVNVSYPEVVDFWSAIMSDHNEMIAHLLDPQEQDLIGQALDSSAVFRGIKEGNQARALSGGDVVRATEELIDFESVLSQGIDSGQIRSIMYPVFTDHLRRETLKFADELKRSGNRT